MYSIPLPCRRTSPANDNVVTLKTTESSPQLLKIFQTNDHEWFLRFALEFTNDSTELLKTVAWYMGTTGDPMNRLQTL